MFWGLILKANRKYSQRTSKSFHISQAALDSTSSQGGPTQIFLTYEEQKFLICTLHKDRCEQVSLDLNFSEGDELSFQSQGSGNVTLSGYLIDQDPMGLMGDDSGEEEESEVEAEELEDARVALDKKAKKKGEKLGKAATSATATEEDEDDDDEDDSDFNVEGALDGEVEEDDGDEDDDDDDEDEDDDDENDEEQEDAESEDEEVQQPKAKQPKLDKPHKQQNGVAKETVEQKGKKDKKNKKENKEQKQQQQQQKQGGEKVLSGGVKIEDIRVGNGPEAKTGKRTTVYYEGRLKSNNKVFDSLKQGAGFKFGLGRGEVIKGWDIGVAGMKVGGKRRITCPPHMAYGARGSPPTIPPNSTLVFEVELKGVN